MSLSERINREVGRFVACDRCGGSPAVHNPHPLNDAFVGHEYTVSDLVYPEPEWRRRMLERLATKGLVAEKALDR